MLAIRMQRRGRKGHAQFRVILQDSHRSPSTGKVTAYLGNYNPHTKEAQLDTEKLEFYLNHGAQPSNRVATLLKKEGVKLPDWVKIDTSKSKKTKNPEKYGSDEAPAAEAEAPEGDAPAADESASDETPAEEAPKEEPKEEKPAEEKAEEAPAEESADDDKKE